MSTDPSPEVISLARRLYETYCDALSLEPGLITALPEWDGLDAPQIAAWESVAVEARVDVAEDARLPAQERPLTVNWLNASPGYTVIVQYREMPAAADFTRIRKELLDAGARHVVFVPAAITGLSALTLPPPRTDARQEWASPPRTPGEVPGYGPVQQ